MPFNEGSFDLDAIIESVRNQKPENKDYQPMDYSRIKKTTVTKDKVEEAALYVEFRNFYRTSPYYMEANDEAKCAREKDEEHTLTWKEQERAKANKKTTSWTLDDTVEDWMFVKGPGFPAEIMEEFEHLRPKDMKTTQTSISKTPEEEEEKTTREEKIETGKKKSNTNTKNTTDNTNTKTSNGGKETPAKRKSTRGVSVAAKKKTAATAATDNFGDQLNVLEELEAKEDEWEDDHSSSEDDDEEEVDEYEFADEEEYCSFSDDEDKVTTASGKATLKSAGKDLTRLSKSARDAEEKTRKRRRKRMLERRKRGGKSETTLFDDSTDEDHFAKNDDEDSIEEGAENEACF